MRPDRWRVDEPLAEITVDTRDDETLSLFVRWDDRDKAHNLILDGVTSCFREALAKDQISKTLIRNETAKSSALICSESLVCSESLIIGGDA